MKWFKHFSDAYSNLKLRIVRQQFKATGYGVYWMCLELVAQQGDFDFQILGEKQWKKVLEFEFGLTEHELNPILKQFSELGLIDAKKFSEGTLYIPKMIEYQDEYREKVGRMSRHNPDVVGLDKIRTDKNRTEEEKLLHKNTISLMGDFRKINPALEFSNRTEYLAARWIIEQAGLDEAKKALDYAEKHNTEEFGLLITTPWEMKKKWAKLNLKAERKNNGKK